MPQWRDFLDRFRPAGAPGAAARRGVPSDRKADAVAELMPLVSLLDDDQAQAERIREQARDRAAQVRAAADHGRAATITRARMEALAVRDDAAARARAKAAAECEQLLSDSEAEIGRLRARVDERMPASVDQVVALVRSVMDDFCGRPGRSTAG